MKKIEKWLSRELPLRSLLTIIPILFFIKEVWYAICKSGIKNFHPPKSEDFNQVVMLHDEIMDLGTKNLVILCTREELEYRIVPLILLQIIFLAFRVPTMVRLTFLLCTIIITSIMFGLIHGNYLNVFMQGFDGMISAFLFLKYGGYVTKINLSIFRKIVIASAIVISFHFIWDTLA